MRIVLLNTHSTLNRGDAGIVLAQIDLLRRYFSELKLSLTSRTPRVDRNFYEARGVQVYPPLTPAPGVFIGPGKKIVGSLKNLVDLKAKSELLREFKESDLIIASGGGYLYSYGGFLPGPTFLQHALHIKIANILKKPVILFPQSFGPFLNSPASALLRSILQEDNVRAVFAREEFSLRFLSELVGERHREKIKFCPDLTFLLEKRNNPGIGRAVEGLHRPVLALTLRDWHFGEVKSTGERQRHRENYLRSLLETAAAFVERFGGSVVVFPQAIGPGLLEDDRIISLEFYQRSRNLPGKERIVLLPSESLNSPYDVIDLLARSDLVLATRFHSALFALIGGTPPIAIGYQHKSEGILRSLKMEEHFLNMAELSSERVLGLVAKVLGRQNSVREMMKNEVASSREKIVAGLDKYLKGYGRNF